MFGRKAKRYQDFINYEKRIKSAAWGLDIVCFGSSIAENDINFDRWGIKGLSFASSPQSLNKDFQLLQCYADRVRFEGTVVITLAEFSLLVDDYYDDLHQYKYYHLLPHRDIWGFHSFKRLVYQILPFLLDKNLLKEELSEQIRKVLYRKANNLETAINHSANNYFKGWNKEFRLDDWDISLWDKRIHMSIDRIVRMVEYAKSRGLCPKIVILPMSNAMKAKIPENVLKDCLWKPLDRMKADAQILNYYNIREITDNNLYKDAIRLNDAGMDLFNKMLMDDLEIQKTDTSVLKQGQQRQYRICDDLILPWIAFGTGVIRKYSRNPALFLKYHLFELLLSIKHLSWHRELYGNMFTRRIIRTAYDSGYRIFDSGRIYGYSEKMLGTISDREDIRYITKCSLMDIERNASPNNVSGNLDISLRNLCRDRVDVLLLHWPEGSQWKDIYRQIVEEYKKGRCLAYGVCNINVEQLDEIQKEGLPLPMIIQAEIHPLNSKAELCHYCRINKIQLMAHTPTARSCDKIRNSETLKKLGQKYNKNPVQVVLRWHYQNEIIPVVSTFNRKHMLENIDIMDFNLSDAEMKSIDAMNEDYEFITVRGIDDPNYIYNY